MKKNTVCSFILTFALLIAGTAFSQQASELKLDPLLLVSLKECRNIAKTLGDELYPGWDFNKTPVLFYRPQVQELLIGFPHKPEGFSEYTGFLPLEKETIYVRNGKTFIDIDDQNTTREIAGVETLVVADQFSRMRNQMRDVLTQRTPAFASQWLEDWGYLQSPYKELQIILHEGFHVYQKRKAPEKGANEMVVTRYPVLDAENNALYALEGRILRDALLSEDAPTRREKMREFVAMRTRRQSRLAREFVEYENRNEFSEGTAKYVEYKFLKAGERIEPVPEMYYHAGFRGYRGVLSGQFREAMQDVAAGSDTRFANRFGAGPLRFRLYELGACQALLLDEFAPEWKQRIFDEGVYLADLLRSAAGLSEAEMETYLKKARAEYDYDEAYRNKQEFEQEGRRVIQERVARILQTEQTLVKVAYGELSDKAIVARFTPFGVTQVSAESLLYEQVPALVLFKKGVMLDFKRAVAVLVDTRKKEVVFAVEKPAAAFATGSMNKMETEDFVFSGAEMEVTREGKSVLMRLMKPREP
jgi:hypothetical protein